MNETMTLCLEIIFWLALFVVFYTHIWATELCFIFLSS